jgi:hypothetical protein
VSLTHKANKKAMSAADEWIRKWNNNIADESIEFFQKNQNSPRFYFKEFELDKDFFLYDDSPPSTKEDDVTSPIIVPKKEENIIETGPKKLYSSLTDFSFPSTS